MNYDTAYRSAKKLNNRFSAEIFDMQIVCARAAAVLLRFFEGGKFPSRMRRLRNCAPDRPWPRMRNLLCASFLPPRITHGHRGQTGREIEQRPLL